MHRPWNTCPQQGSDRRSSASSWKSTKQIAHWPSPHKAPSAKGSLSTSVASSLGFPRRQPLAVRLHPPLLPVLAPGAAAGGAAHTGTGACLCGCRSTAASMMATICSGTSAPVSAASRTASKTVETSAASSSERSRDCTPSRKAWTLSRTEAVDGAAANANVRRVEPRAGIAGIGTAWRPGAAWGEATAGALRPAAVHERQTWDMPAAMLHQNPDPHEPHCRRW